MSDEVVDFLKLVLKKLDYLGERIDRIERILSPGSENEDDMLMCLELLDSNLYLTSEMIGRHPILGARYPHIAQQIHLLNTVKERYNLSEVRMGRGNRRYLYRKEDEGRVLKMLKHTASNNRKSELDDIITFLQTHYAGEKLTVEDVRQMFNYHFNIKSSQKVAGILKQLHNQGIVEPISIGLIKILS